MKMIITVFSLNLSSETVDYQAVYSGGSGEVYVLGVVPHSHIAVVVYSVDDGEIIKQVLRFYSGCRKQQNYERNVLRIEMFQTF